MSWVLDTGTSGAMFASRDDVSHDVMPPESLEFELIFEFALNG